MSDESAVSMVKMLAERCPNLFKELAQEANKSDGHVADTITDLRNDLKSEQVMIDWGWGKGVITERKQIIAVFAHFADDWPSYASLRSAIRYYVKHNGRE